MGDSTSISWTDATWNPVRGCSRVSEGCRNCYAEKVAARFSDLGQAYEGLADRTRKGSKWTGVVRLVGEHIEDPLRWQKPRRIFVNSMSDLFHESLDDDDIDRVFAVMLLAPRHTFQVLTKRAARMRQYMTNPALYDRVLRAAADLRILRPELNQVGISNPATSPARWIWLGVSVENQAAADERIPELLATPAAIRFLSCEPLLGPVLLDDGHNSWLTCSGPSDKDDEAGCCESRYVNGTCFRGVDWVIAGCESGHGARECRVGWLRSLRDQCADARVAFFLKQAVEATVFGNGMTDGAAVVTVGTNSHVKGRGNGGAVIELPYLDGVQHAQFPEVRR